MADGNETVGKMKVLSVLESLPGLGKVKARRLMETVGHLARAVASRGSAPTSARRSSGRPPAERSRTAGPGPADRLPHLRPLRPRRGRQGDRRRPAGGRRPAPVAEPLVDHPAAPPGRARGRLRLRRPAHVRGPRRRRRLLRVGRVPRQPLRHPGARPGAGPRRPARDRPPGRPAGPGPASRRHPGPAAARRRPRSRPSGCGAGATTRTHVARRLAEGAEEERQGRAAGRRTWWSTTPSRRPPPMWPLYWTIVARAPPRPRRAPDPADPA